MRKIKKSSMKNKVRDLIKILGIGIDELVIEINIGEFTFDSIEWIEEDDRIVLHKFEEDFDWEFDFDDLDDEKQVIVWKYLSIIYN